MTHAIEHSDAFQHTMWT